MEAIAMPVMRTEVMAVLLCVTLVAASHASPVPQVAKMMKAAAADRPGDASMITLHSLPVPTPGPDEVLIAVHTAGVASWDVAIRQRPTRIKHSSFPLVLGTDGAGTIAVLGKNVHGFKLGEGVYSYSWDNPQGGFYAEYVAVPADRVGHVPKGLSLQEAGAIGTTGLTAQQGIDDALKLKAGETVIIHGAAGGVGTLAIQFAKLRGARVIATASGADGRALVEGLGADLVVDGRTGDIAAAAHTLAPGGVDAVLGLAGGDFLERCIDTLGPHGRAAYPNGVSPEPKARAGVDVVVYDAIPGVKEFAHLNAAIVAAHLRVPIAAEFALADAGKAQQRLEAGHVLGKIVLKVAPERD
jgi:NADPH:quinone reductase-like Zn-dependent oxidoreductase